MALKIQIVDGNTGDQYRAEVSHKGFLQVGIRNGSPPLQGEASDFRFFSQLVSSAGDGTGTTNMNVNGAATSQVFTLNSVSEYDIRIMKFMIFIEDTTVAHGTFGAIPLLTNGIDISLIEAGEETFLIQSAKSFAHLIQQTFAERPFGDGTTSFEIENSTVGPPSADAQVLPFDVGALVPSGVRIGRGTLDKLQVKVNDNLEGLISFTVRAVGYRHYP